MTGVCQSKKAANANYRVSVCLRNNLQIEGGYTARVKEHVGPEIKRLRGRTPLDELAKKSGVDKGTLNRIELEKQNPHRATLRMIVSALGVRADQTKHPRLLEAMNEPLGRGDSSREAAARPEDGLAELFRYIRTLESSQRSDFIHGIIALLNAIEYSSPAASAGAAQGDDA